MTRPWYEVAFEELYPVVYQHRDDSEARRAADTWGHLFAGSGPVLDLTCGTGRHMQAFAAAGVNMFGMDLSMYLLDEAVSREGARGRLVNADMRAVPFQNGSLGGVISMFTSFGYFETDEENTAVISEVASALRSGGHFLFDFLNAAAVRKAGDMNREREVDAYLVNEDRRVSKDGRVVTKRVVVSSGGSVATQYEERVRLFGHGELNEMLSSNGLRVLTMAGDYDGTDFDENTSSRLIFLTTREAR